MQNTYKVYKHTTPNGKVYIGITSQKLRCRWRCGKGYIQSPMFYNAIMKYGWDNIQHEILFENLTKEEACEKEILLIALYKSNQKKFGYNMQSGGNVQIKISEETRKKISEANRRRIVSEETKKKIMQSSNNKPIIQLNMRGEYIRTHESARKALKYIDINKDVHPAIRDCCNGKRKYAYGYKWKWQIS